MMNKQLANKIITLIFGMAVVLALEARAQDGNWDPYVHSVIISPAPLLPVEFGGTGVCTLKPGNNGGTDLPLGNPAGTNAFDRMVVTISLANGVPNVSDPLNAASALTALGGLGKVYWDWSYTPATRTFRGVQNRVIPGYTAEEVTIQYRVAENTFRTGDPFAFNGLNVNISPPGYTNPQQTDNDKASQYAYVEAIDYGDAPISYGVAGHYIDTTKDGTATPGPYYNRFFWLGSHIDADTNYVASADAMGDDNNAINGLYRVNQDDEDGVTFPVMIPGTTVVIPVSYTFDAGSKPTTSLRDWAYLSAWIDWNGDGVFDDSDGSPEVVSHTWTYSDSTGQNSWVNKQQRQFTTTVNLSVTVPANAVVDRPIFARFRISTAPKLSPTGMAANGEVEDYQINVGPLSTAIDLKVYAAEADKVMIDISTVNENGKHPIEVYAKIDGVWKLVATVPADQIIGFGSNTYKVEAVGLTPGASYEFKIVDESGHIFESGLIEVARSLVAVEAMTLAPKLITLSFKTTPGLAYQVMVCEELGAPWKVEYVRSPTKNGFSDLNNKPFTAGPGATTKVEVPRNDREKAFFKIIQAQ